MCISVGITSALTRVSLDSKLYPSEIDKDKLMSETNNVKGRFAVFLDELQQHLLNLQKEEKIDVPVVISQIVLYEKEVRALLSQCNSFQDVFQSLNTSKYLSFVDYDLVKLLVEYGNEEIKSKFIAYKRSLQKLFKNRIIKLEEKNCVVIDKSIADETRDLDQLLNCVKFILGQEDLTLHWEDFNPQQSSEIPTEDVLEEESIASSSSQETASSGEDRFTVQSSLQGDSEVITAVNTPPENSLSGNH